MLQLLGRILLWILNLLLPHTAEEAIQVYEDADGRPQSNQDVLEFEAVSWLIAHNRDPAAALKAFESEGGHPNSDISDRDFEGIRNWLQRWVKEAGRTIVTEEAHATT